MKHRVMNKPTSIFTDNLQKQQLDFFFFSPDISIPYTLASRTSILILLTNLKFVYSSPFTTADITSLSSLL